MLIETTKARRIVITDIRNAFELRRYIEDEKRNIIKPVNALWESQRKIVTVDITREALETGIVPGEWSEFWAKTIREFVRDDVIPEWLKSISDAGNGIARKVNRIQRKQFDFDSTMTSVKTWIDRNGGNLIKDLTAAQFNTIHALLQHQIALGVTSPYVLAERIRPFIGLTQRETLALVKVMTSLAEEGVPAGIANSRIAKYANFLHRNRADRIARTEISNAYNFGQMDSLRQAAAEGWLPGEPQKSWIAGGKEPCETCEGNEADGPIALDAQFSSGHDHPTAHPSCECSVAYTIIRE